MCNLTISSILKKQNSYVTECTHTLACVVMKGLISARAHLERVLSLHGSVLKCIKSDRKIQDMGQKIYIFTFHMYSFTFSNHTKCAVFS